MTHSTHILIPRDGTQDHDSYPTDTESQIVAARQALRASGLESAEVWAGEDPSAVRTGQVLWAAARPGEPGHDPGLDAAVAEAAEDDREAEELAGLHRISTPDDDSDGTSAAERLARLEWGSTLYATEAQLAGDALYQWASAGGLNGRDDMIAAIHMGGSAVAEIRREWGDEIADYLEARWDVAVERALELVDLHMPADEIE